MASLTVDVALVVATEMRRWTRPLLDAVGDSIEFEDPAPLRHLLREAGLDALADPALAGDVQTLAGEISAVAATLDAALDALAAVRDGGGELDAAGKVIDAAARLGDLLGGDSAARGASQSALERLTKAAEDRSLPLAEPLDVMARRLAAHLTWIWLQRDRQYVLGLLFCLGILQRGEIRQGSRIRLPDIDLGQFRLWLTDPSAAGQALVGRYSSLGFLEDLAVVLREAGLPHRFDTSPLPGEVGGAADADPALELAPNESLLMPLAGADFDEASSEVGILLREAPGTDPDAEPAHLAVTVYGGVDGALKKDLGRDLHLETGGAIEATAAPLVVLGEDGASAAPRPGQAGLAEFLAQATLAWRPPAADRVWAALGDAVILGPEDGSAEGSASASVTLTLERQDSTTELAIGATVSKVQLTFGVAGSDGFLRYILPADGICVPFGLSVEWSTVSGLTFDGQAKLEYEKAIAASLLGVIDLRRLHLAFAVGGDGLDGFVGVDLSARLGPISVSVDKLGFGLGAGTDVEDRRALRLDFGAFDVSVGLQPPSGIGLSLDLGAVRGGGHLEVEDDRYAGALEFAAGDLTLAAFGVVETGTRADESGFSMLLFVSGQFAPVQLGFGFTLLSVGGLLGVHRDVDPDALFAAVRAGTAGDLLAPEDPVRDAARLIALAGGIFPSRRGQYVFGPTVKLGWGTPTMMSLDLALAATLPEPLRLVLIGRLKGTIPSPVAPILRVNLDLAGLLDLSGRRLELEGILFDSAIQAIPVEGGFALRSSWGPERALIFSIGGLHPGFEAPPRFPDLPRMGTTLTKGSMLRLTLGGYFAVTSNTFQIGAAVDLRVSAAGFTLLGGLGFDALVEFDPFRMVVDVRARVQVMKGRRSITKLTFRGALSGPNPWHARGKVVVEIPILPDVTVGASATFGRETTVPSKPVDVLELVVKAIGSAEAWRPAGPPAGLVLAPGAEGRIDPRGALRLRQEAAPLDQPWEHFYGKPIAGVTRTAVDGISVAGTPLTLGDPTEAAFPPAAFRRLTEAQRLAAPAFDDQTAGVEVDPSALMAGGDTALKDDARDTVVHGPEAQDTLARDAGPTGVALEAPPASPPVVRVRPERWRAADAEGRPIGPPTSWGVASLGPYAPVLAAEAAA